MKKICVFLSLAIILVAGVWAALDMAALPRTYDDKETNLLDLYADPESYDVSDPDGAASIIVQENLALTKAVNTVTAIVFDFRGYDTMGEAFILVTAISGTMIILRKRQKGAGNPHETER